MCNQMPIETQVTMLQQRIDVLQGRNMVKAHQEAKRSEGQAMGEVPCVLPFDS